jgi:hypothetical protein
MNSITYAIIRAIELACLVFGKDVHIERDAPGVSLWDFARSEVHSTGCREYWGLGLHACVSIKA